MALACQKNSYLKELTTIVRSCHEADCQVIRDGKKVKLKGWEVVLEDTILFPEGGGQPDDYGTINDLAVHKITKCGTATCNFVTEKFDPGTEVLLKVDWSRRFDHMQQHSGQHLVTAVAESMFGYKTTSWSLGEKLSFVELDTDDMSEKEMELLEVSVNEKIRDGVNVSPVLFEDKDDPKLEGIRCRGLPNDDVGPVRVVVVEGIDSTLCCGTHVSNLTDLQMIKLLSAEKTKKKKVHLHFVVGNRVLKYLSRCHKVERELTAILKGPLDQHSDLAEKAVKGWKTSTKSVTQLLRDVAVFEAERYKSQPVKEPVFVLHRKEGDNEFLNMLSKELETETVVCLLTAGDEKGSGLFLVSGAEDLVKTAGPKVAEILEGKGGFNRGVYQGKANKLAHRSKAEQIIKNYIASTSS